jgi:hypothetical protein
MSRTALRRGLPRPGVDHPFTHVGEAAPLVVVAPALGGLEPPGDVASGAVVARTLSPGTPSAESGFVVPKDGASWKVALVGDEGSPPSPSPIENRLQEARVKMALAEMTMARTSTRFRCRPALEVEFLWRRIPELEMD